MIKQGNARRWRNISWPPRSRTTLLFACGLLYIVPSLQVSSSRIMSWSDTNVQAKFLDWQCWKHIRWGSRLIEPFILPGTLWRAFRMRTVTEPQQKAKHTNFFLSRDPMTLYFPRPYGTESKLSERSSAKYYWRQLSQALFCFLEGAGSVFASSCIWFCIKGVGKARPVPIWVGFRRKRRKKDLAEPLLQDILIDDGSRSCLRERECSALAWFLQPNSTKVSGYKDPSRALLRDSVKKVRGKEIKPDSTKEKSTGR